MSDKTFQLFVVEALKYNEFAKQLKRKQSFDLRSVAQSSGSNFGGPVEEAGIVQFPADLAQQETSGLGQLFRFRNEKRDAVEVRPCSELN